MTAPRHDADRTIDSTDNNEYADDIRDENLWEEDLLDTDHATDDDIPWGADEARTGDRPVYDEQGYEHGPGDR